MRPSTSFAVFVILPLAWACGSSLTAPGIATLEPPGSPAPPPVSPAPVPGPTIPKPPPPSWSTWQFVVTVSTTGQRIQDPAPLLVEGSCFPTFAHGCDTFKSVHRVGANARDTLPAVNTFNGLNSVRFQYLKSNCRNLGAETQWVDWRDYEPDDPLPEVTFEVDCH